MIELNKNILIGSKGRLLFPMSKIVKGATLFVEPQEYSDYNTMHGKNFNVVKLSKDNGGFGFLLNQMNEYAYKNSLASYWFMDDDILSFKFRDKSSNLQTELNKMQEIAEKNKYSQLMCSFAGHNWYYEGMVKEKIGAWCCILNNTNDIRKYALADEELPIFNDWDVSAKLIKNGLKTACYYGMMFVHKMKSQKGGAEMLYRNKEKTQQAIEILKARYPDCIKIVTAHNQEEARFIWKKL